MGSSLKRDFCFSSTSSSGEEDVDSASKSPVPLHIETVFHNQVSDDLNVESLKREYQFHMQRAQEIFDLLINCQFQPKASLISSDLSPKRPKYNDQPIVNNMKHLLKALSRKPRDLKFSPSGSHFFATSLDGGIFLWDAQAQNIKSIHYLTSHLNRVTHAEHTCWRSEDNLILSAEGPQSEIIQLNLSTQKFETLHKSHQPVTAMSQVHRGNKLLSGNYEKCIEMWNLDNKDAAPMVLHRKHTSMIQSILAVDDFVYSGGADCRLIAHSLSNNSTLFEQKQDARISHINLLDPNCLLITFCTAEPKQFGLLDRRQERLAMRFGWEEESNISRYLSPSVSADRKMLACGTSVPSTQRPSSINFFDLRQQGKIVQTIDAASSKEHRRFLKTEFNNSSINSTLTALSTDGTISFIPLR